MQKQKNETLNIQELEEIDCELSNLGQQFQELLKNHSNKQILTACFSKSIEDARTTIRLTIRDAKGKELNEAIEAINKR